MVVVVVGEGAYAELCECEASHRASFALKSPQCISLLEINAICGAVGIRLSATVRQLHPPPSHCR